MPRREPGAVLEDPDAVVAQTLDVVPRGTATARSGRRAAAGARSLCLRSGTPGAAAFALRVRRALEGAGVQIEAFA